jgi:hypothetical protein
MRDNSPLKAKFTCLRFCAGLFCWLTLTLTMRRFCFVLIGFAFLANFPASAQNIVPSIEWERSYRDSACEFNCAVPAKDGGYLLGGRTYNVGAQPPEDDCVLVKIDNQGIAQWTQVLGGIGGQTIKDLRQTSDGGYVFAATSNSPPSELFVEHAWVVKVDSTGKKQWEQILGGAGSSPASIWQASDGGYLLCGSSPGGFGSADGWLLMLTAQGNLQWERFFGGESGESFISGTETSDRGHLLVGNSRSVPSGERRRFPSSLAGLGF